MRLHCKACGAVVIVAASYIRDCIPPGTCQSVALQDSACSGGVWFTPPSADEPTWMVRHPDLFNIGSNSPSAGISTPPFPLRIRLR